MTKIVDCFIFNGEIDSNKLRFYYGTEDYAVDVTESAERLIVKNGKIVIPAGFSFNYYFGDVAENKRKQLTIVNEYNSTTTKLQESRSADFVADVKFPVPYFSMKLDLSKYNYTQTWVANSDIRKHLLKYFAPFQKNNILEIGSHEGLSACCFSDNLLSHDESTLDCVDPFCLDDKTTPLTEQTEQIFIHNIAKSISSQKCSFHKMMSDEFFKTNRQTFNLIYIDGSHLVENIERDMKNSFRVLEMNGIMWMDDYASSESVTQCINQIVLHFGERVELLYKGWQLALRKIK